jgi:hypothetical protein
MAVVTPRLLTSECSAHYPRLWNLIEDVSTQQHVRRYPIMLDMINFIQEFENWVIVNTDHIASVIKLDAPEYVEVASYGAQPLISLRLEYFADYIGHFVLKQEEIAKQMLYDLGDWHHAILQRTAPPSLPHYNGRKRCPNCGKHSVLQHEKDYFCVNRECQHSWVNG